MKFAIAEAKNDWSIRPKNHLSATGIMHLDASFLSVS